MTDNQVKIEVAFALPNKQSILQVTVEPGTTVKEAIKASGILERYREIDLEKNAVGIWSRACKLDTVPVDGDRIEIYRPLIADPKEARRLRAEKAKSEGRADKVTGGRPKDKKAES